MADAPATPALLETAVRRAGAAHAAWRRPGTLSMRHATQEREQRGATLRALLPPPTYEVAWAAGATLSDAAAIACALDTLAQLSFSPVAAPPANGARTRHARTAAPPLSPREREVNALVSAGLTNKEIAARLTITERTAENHVQHVLDKLGFRTRSQIAVWAARVAPPTPAAP